MDPGTFFIGLVLLVIIGGGIFLLAGGGSWLSRRRSDPERDKLQDPHGTEGRREERPTHTPVRNP